MIGIPTGTLYLYPVVRKTSCFKQFPNKCAGRVAGRLLDVPKTGMAPLLFTVKVRTPNHAKLSWSKLVQLDVFSRTCVYFNHDSVPNGWGNLWTSVDTEDWTATAAAKPSRHLKTDKLLTDYCCEHIKQDGRHPVIVKSTVYHDKQGKSHIGSVQQRACVCVCVFANHV